MSGDALDGNNYIAYNLLYVIKIQKYICVCGQIRLYIKDANLVEQITAYRQVVYPRPISSGVGMQGVSYMQVMTHTVHNPGVCKFEMLAV